VLFTTECVTIYWIRISSMRMRPPYRFFQNLTDERLPNHLCGFIGQDEWGLQLYCMTTSEPVHPNILYDFWKVSVDIYMWTGMPVITESLMSVWSVVGLMPDVNSQKLCRLFLNRLKLLTLKPKKVLHSVTNFSR